MHYPLCVCARMFIYVVRIGLRDKVRFLVQKVQDLFVCGIRGCIIVKHLRIKTEKVLPVLHALYIKTIVHVYQHILVRKLIKSALR